jgi:hypothetical protein
MKSIVREKDPSEIVTRLIPLGYKLKATDENGKEVETEHRLDISSVNDGKNYIDDGAGIELYGIRVGYVEFDDVTVASTLLIKGEEWMQNNNKLQVSYTVTALDLSLNGLDVDDFNVGFEHPVRNSLLGIDDRIRIIKKSIDVCEEVKSTVEFGDNFETLSESIKKHSDSLNLITSDYVTNQKLENTITKTQTEIKQTTEDISLKVTGFTDEMTAMDERVKTVEASLELKVGRDENNQIISMINASADVITLNSNRLVINSDNFKLTKDGTMTVSKGYIGNLQITDKLFLDDKQLWWFDAVRTEENNQMISLPGYYAYADGIGTFYGHVLQDNGEDGDEYRELNIMNGKLFFNNKAKWLDIQNIEIPLFRFGAQNSFGFYEMVLEASVIVTENGLIDDSQLEYKGIKLVKSRIA